MPFKYNDFANINGTHQEYKKIKIYPLKLKDYIKYQNNLNILAFYHKNIIENNILQMSFLQVLLIVFMENELLRLQKQYQNDAEEVNRKVACLNYLHILFNKKNKSIDLEPYLTHFISIILGCASYQDFIAFIAFVCNLEISDIQIKLETTNAYITKVFIKIGDAVLNENDFDEFRKIILRQNAIDFDYVKEYDSDLEAKRNVFNKQKEFEYANMEEQIFTLGAMTHLSSTELMEYTFYQFSKLMERSSMLMEYTMYKPLESAGFITFKNGGIPHYLSHVKKHGRYDDLYIDKDKFTDNTLKKFAQEGE